MPKRAKIVATIGPACWDKDTLKSLLLAGVNVARLNFSHGTHESHARVITLLRKLAEELDIPVTILQDLQGPKIRTGELPNGPIEIRAGETLTLTVSPVPGDTHLIPVDFPELTQSARIGKPILLDDGQMEVVVTAVNADHVETRVIQGGILKSHKGINLPGTALHISGFTEKDQADLAFGLSQGVDAIAISFVRSAADVQQVRHAAQEIAKDQEKPALENIPLIAKLERPEALENLEEIILAGDGVMVARGDLGVEVPAERVPIEQKRIIQSANQHSKIVITATQMLDSMIHNPRPTRAEASDVANAIFDGTDAVMLSGETASGAYPLKAVQAMNAIICQAEEHLDSWGRWNEGSKRLNEPNDDAFFTTKAACELAHDSNVAAIAVFTHSGRTALLMSKARPDVPILAFTPISEVYQRIGMYWGVVPHLTPPADTIPEMLQHVEDAIIKRFNALANQQVVLVCGYPLHEFRPTNLTLLHTIGLGQ